MVDCHFHKRDQLQTALLMMTMMTYCAKDLISVSIHATKYSN